MHIILNHSSMVPIYEQLMEQIKSEIINTALKEGEALPSVRSLAGELRISALTVKKAYGNPPMVYMGPIGLEPMTLCL